MAGEGMQLAMLAAQLLTAGGTGGILFTLGKVLERQKSHGERIEALETSERASARKEVHV